MPKKISDCIPWAKERSEEHNAQINNANIDDIVNEMKPWYDTYL